MAIREGKGPKGREAQPPPDDLPAGQDLDRVQTGPASETSWAEQVRGPAESQPLRLPAPAGVTADPTQVEEYRISPLSTEGRTILVATLEERRSSRTTSWTFPQLIEALHSTGMLRLFAFTGGIARGAKRGLVVGRSDTDALACVAGVGTAEHTMKVLAAAVAKDLFAGNVYEVKASVYAESNGAACGRLRVGRFFDVTIFFGGPWRHWVTNQDPLLVCWRDGVRCAELAELACEDPSLMRDGVPESGSLPTSHQSYLAVLNRMAAAGGLGDFLSAGLGNLFLSFTENVERWPERFCKYADDHGRELFGPAVSWFWRTGLIHRLSTFARDEFLLPNFVHALMEQSGGGWTDETALRARVTLDWVSADLRQICPTGLNELPFELIAHAWAIRNFPAVLFEATRHPPVELPLYSATPQDRARWVGAIAWLLTTPDAHAVRSAGTDGGGVLGRVLRTATALIHVVGRNDALIRDAAPSPVEMRAAAALLVQELERTEVGRSEPTGIAYFYFLLRDRPDLAVSILEDEHLCACLHAQLLRHRLRPAGLRAWVVQHLLAEDRLAQSTEIKHARRVAAAELDADRLSPFLKPALDACLTGLLETELQKVVSHALQKRGRRDPQALLSALPLPEEPRSRVIEALRYCLTLPCLQEGQAAAMKALARGVLVSALAEADKGGPVKLPRDALRALVIWLSHRAEPWAFEDSELFEILQERCEAKTAADCLTTPALPVDLRERLGVAGAGLKSLLAELFVLDAPELPQTGRPWGPHAQPTVVVRSESGWSPDANSDADPTELGLQSRRRSAGPARRKWTPKALREYLRTQPDTIAPDALTALALRCCQGSVDNELGILTDRALPAAIRRLRLRLDDLRAVGRARGGDALHQIRWRAYQDALRYGVGFLGADFPEDDHEDFWSNLEFVCRAQPALMAQLATPLVEKVFDGASRRPFRDRTGLVDALAKLVTRRPLRQRCNLVLESLWTDAAQRCQELLRVSRIDPAAISEALRLFARICKARGLGIDLRQMPLLLERAVANRQLREDAELWGAIGPLCGSRHSKLAPLSSRCPVAEATPKLRQLVEQHVEVRASAPRPQPMPPAVADAVKVRRRSAPRLADPVADLVADGIVNQDPDWLGRARTLSLTVPRRGPLLDADETNLCSMLISAQLESEAGVDLVLLRTVAAAVPLPRIRQECSGFAYNALATLLEVAPTQEGGAEVCTSLARRFVPRGLQYRLLENAGLRDLAFRCLPFLPQGSSEMAVLAAAVLTVSTLNEDDAITATERVELRTRMSARTQDAANRIVAIACVFVCRMVGSHAAEVDWRVRHAPRARRALANIAGLLVDLGKPRVHADDVAMMISACYMLNAGAKPPPEGHCIAEVQQFLGSCIAAMPNAVDTPWHETFVDGDARHSISDFDDRLWTMADFLRAGYLAMPAEGPMREFDPGRHPLCGEPAPEGVLVDATPRLGLAHALQYAAHALVDTGRATNAFSHRAARELVIVTLAHVVEMFQAAGEVDDELFALVAYAFEVAATCELLPADAAQRGPSQGVSTRKRLVVGVDALLQEVSRRGLWACFERAVQNLYGLTRWHRERKPGAAAAGKTTSSRRGRVQTIKMEYVRRTVSCGDIHGALLAVSGWYARATTGAQSALTPEMVVAAPMLATTLVLQRVLRKLQAIGVKTKDKAFPANDAQWNEGWVLRLSAAEELMSVLEARPDVEALRSTWNDVLWDPFQTAFLDVLRGLGSMQKTLKAWNESETQVPRDLRGRTFRVRASGRTLRELVVSWEVITGQTELPDLAIPMEAMVGPLDPTTQKRPWRPGLQDCDVALARLHLLRDIARERQARLDALAALIQRLRNAYRDATTRPEGSEP